MVCVFNMCTYYTVCVLRQCERICIRTKRSDNLTLYNLRNRRDTRPTITQMVRLKNHTPYPIRDLIQKPSLLYVHGFNSPPQETISWNSFLNWLPVLTNPHTPVRFGYFYYYHASRLHIPRSRRAIAASPSASE